MLDKNDLQAIGKLIDSKISYAFSEFFKDILEPYFVQRDKEIDRRFDEIDRRFDENDKDHTRLFRAIGRNRDEHDDIFAQLESHSKRIKKLEKAVSTS